MDAQRPEDLDAAMRRVLAGLAMVSAGTIASYSPVASKGGHGLKAPISGDPHSPAEHHAAAYNAQTDDWGRRQILDRARRELDGLRRRAVPVDHVERPEQPHERHARLLARGEGVELHEAARALNCPPSELLRLRQDDGRDGYTGWPLPDQPTARQSRDERAARAREMFARGLTRVQIASILGTDRATVRTYPRPS